MLQQTCPSNILTTTLKVIVQTAPEPPSASPRELPDGLVDVREHAVFCPPPTYGSPEAMELWHKKAAEERHHFGEIINAVTPSDQVRATEHGNCPYTAAVSQVNSDTHSFGQASHNHFRLVSNNMLGRRRATPAPPLLQHCALFVQAQERTMHFGLSSCKHGLQVWRNACAAAVSQINGDVHRFFKEKRAKQLPLPDGTYDRKTGADDYPPRSAEDFVKFNA